MLHVHHQRARVRGRQQADMFQLARQLMGQVCCSATGSAAATQAKVIRLVILGCDKCSYRPDVITFPRQRRRLGTILRLLILLQPDPRTQLQHDHDYDDHNDDFGSCAYLYV